MNSRFVPFRILLILALFFGLFFISFTPPTASTAAVQQVAPQGAVQELSLDDGKPDCAAGTQAAIGGKNFGWANKLTPTSYPATLRSITIGFNRTLIGTEVRPDSIYRIVVYADPEKDGPAENQEPLATFSGRVRGTEDYMTFNLITPVTITSGSFVVGAIDDFGFGQLPAIFDIPGKSTPPGSESYLTFDGGKTWRTQADVLSNVSGCVAPGQSSAGSWMIRATVEAAPVEVPTILSKIKDPAAVEPWSVAVNNLPDERTSEAYVANYVSDNVTIIKADNSFQNVPVGDGTGGAVDGPYGIAVHPNDSRIYVTLFGSNTLPSKEFPIDYATVGAGRVAVLVKQANGTFTQTNQISVGKGPKFPAILSTVSGIKLYVPCGGANRVDVINTATNEKLREIAVGVDPSSCTVSIDGSKLYVTNFGDGTISVIDTKSDTKIKDITIPPTTPLAPGLPPLSALKNPVSATISPANGNLYVAYNRADDQPDGAIVEINTCSDTLLRVIVDPTTTGTPAGAAGATGIAAPTSALERDATTGTTPNAGGGGGGVFGIAAFKGSSISSLVFTNDGVGIAGVLDSRIDQVITAPAIQLDNCPKPRGVAAKAILLPAGSPISQFRFTAYVACGQPENSVSVIRIPVFGENIPNVPVIESAEIGKKIIVHGTGFDNQARIEVMDPETGICLTFEKRAKATDGVRLLQKGTFSDGRSIKSVLKAAPVVYLRVVNPDGSSRLFAQSK
jgi:YVTN family beta-propeller protein